MSKINIKVNQNKKYALRYLSRMKVDVLDIDYIEDQVIYTIDEKDLDRIDLNFIELQDYKGIKRIFKEFLERKHFIIALIISLIIIFLASNMIIKVDVVHSSSDIRELLNDELYDLGIRPFIFKKSYRELQKIKEKIKNEYRDDIEWLEIMDDGMKYTVRVEERIITKEKTVPDYCDVVSTKDATLMNSIVKKGQMRVDINDHVKKRDTIISGEIKFNDVVKNHVCAEGTIYGNTWYTIDVSLPFHHVIKTYTGLKKNNIAVEWGSTYSRIFKIHYRSYDIEKKPILKVGKLAIYKENVQENVIEEAIYSIDEATKEALKLAREKLHLKLDDNATILEEKVLQTNTYESIINLEVFYSVKEIIGERIEKEIILEENGARE